MLGSTPGNESHRPAADEAGCSASTSQIFPPPADELGEGSDDDEAIAIGSLPQSDRSPDFLPVENGDICLLKLDAGNELATLIPGAIVK